MSKGAMSNQARKHNEKYQASNLFSVVLTEFFIGDSF